MTLIALGGQPGTGKTSLAWEIARTLNIDQVIQTDMVKDFLKVSEYDPISYCPSLEAWKFIGKKTPENIVKGFKMHIKNFENVFQELVEISMKRRRVVIVEGVQVTPDVFRKINVSSKVYYYLYVDSEVEHLRRLKVKMKMKPHGKWCKCFDVISVIDDYLKEECRGYGLRLLNNRDIYKTKKIILESIS